MTPADIKTLRKELSCTARELGAALGVEQDSILAWERGEFFPTKKYVDKMEEIRRAGPSAIPRRKRSGREESTAQTLANPEIWRLFRKLLAHAELRSAALKLSEAYPDPAEAEDA